MGPTAGTPPLPKATPGPSITDTLPLPLVMPDAPLGAGKTQPLPATRGPQPNVADTIPRPVSFQDILRSTQAPAPTPTATPTPDAVVMQAPVLVDVTPRALVVETVGGWCDVVVPRNAKIPCERTRAFTTSSDMQTVVRVRVAQGEDAVFEKNTFLGQVELVGLRAAPRGEVTIRARFEVDESGTLKVFATDVQTGREAHALLQLIGIAETKAIEAMQERHLAARVE
jgi:molecular chaperone DnaK